MKFFTSKKETHSQENNSTTVTEDNQVTVRIWLSKINKKPANTFKAAIKNGKDNIKEKKGSESENDIVIGHASIEMPSGEYASMWPHPNENITNIFKHYASTQHTLAQDVMAEEGQADFLICLYSLTIRDIKTAFDQVVQTHVGYVLTGDSSPAETGQSCASLAYYLLRQGGVDKLGASKGSTMASLVITPNNLADFVKEAKEKELEQYPETRNFSYLGLGSGLGKENEYVPPPQKESSCRII